MDVAPRVRAFDVERGAEDGMLSLSVTDGMITSQMDHMHPELTIEALHTEAAAFAHRESLHDEPSLYGVTDGKAVGTYLEHKFQNLLSASFTYDQGSSAKGIDFPELNVDMKVTSIKQPQSSSPSSLLVKRYTDSDIRFWSSSIKRQTTMKREQRT